MNIHAVGVHTARPAEGGCTRGVSAERFETPLVGRAACFWRRGGNPPAPAFPRRGKRERGRSNLLAAAGICLRITPEYRPLTPSPQALTATQKPEFPQKKPVNDWLGFGFEWILKELISMRPDWTVGRVRRASTSHSPPAC